MSAPARYWVVLLALICGAVQPALADTRYVIDVLVINLRDSPTPDGTSLAHMRTGDRFEVIGAQGNYLKVRTPAGEVGWVPQQYTTAEIPKTQVIAGLRQDLAKAKKRAAAAEDERTRLEAQLQQVQEKNGAALRTATQELTTVRKEARDNADQHRAVKQKYDALLERSKQVLEITAERDALREGSARLESQVQQLDDELASVTRSNLVTGLLVGGGLVLAGWVLGSTSRKKKSRFSVG